jgi:hypothetical protein
MSNLQALGIIWNALHDYREIILARAMRRTMMRGARSLTLWQFCMRA